MRKQDNPSEVNKATSPIEVMLEVYFVPFLLGYLKELKMEYLSIVASPQAIELLESFKI